MQLAAQKPPAPPSLGNMLLPSRHARPVPANPQRIPDVVFDATSLGSPLLLDKGWRVGLTANPYAASPDFDDSAWAVRDARNSFEEVHDQDHSADAPVSDSHSRPPGHQRPFAWFRLHVKLTPNHEPIHLLIELPPSQIGSSSSQSLGVDVFANGRQIQPEGPHGDSVERYQPISRIYDLGLAPSETFLT
ncbi:MAG: hypothetical protein ABR991_11395, partial [Terracidiphilus sp.]